jgi:hypothetical protein
MKAKVISFLVALASVFVFAYCSTLPSKMSTQDLGIPNVAACSANFQNVACDAGIGG